MDEPDSRRVDSQCARGSTGSDCRAVGTNPHSHNAWYRKWGHVTGRVEHAVGQRQDAIIATRHGRQGGIRARVAVDERSTGILGGFQIQHRACLVQAFGAVAGGFRGRLMGRVQRAASERPIRKQPGFQRSGTRTEFPFLLSENPFEVRTEIDGRRSADYAADVRFASPDSVQRTISDCHISDCHE